MAKTKAVSEPAEVSLFERLDDLVPLLDKATEPGEQHEVVRLALLTVLGGIKHVASALDQVRVLDISDRNRAALDAKQAAQVEREKRSKH